MNTTYEQTQHCIDVCNRLLRGELSAVETYNQVIQKFAAEPEMSQLNHIRDDHAWAVGRLQENVRDMGGRPATDSGAWGAFSKTLQGTANLLGENSALTILQQGEKHGRRDYEDALADDGVMADTKIMIRSELLPRIEQHIADLELLGKH
jgi:demethoxyubiquinone hydroxylase (CLK1/Coq7/Cat5 family)